MQRIPEIADVEVSDEDDLIDEGRADAQGQGLDVRLIFGWYMP